MISIVTGLAVTFPKSFIKASTNLSPYCHSSKHLEYLLLRANLSVKIVDISGGTISKAIYSMKKALVF